MRKLLIDRTGLRYGRLVVLERAENGSGGNARWKCRCDCGAETVVFACSLARGTTRSCACYRRDTLTGSDRNVSHGCSRTRTYRVWAGILRRCTNRNDPGFKRYGTRGIVVCDRWLSFENFLADMGEAPKGLTIDRISVNGGYEPGNCRWLDYQGQARNRRNNHRIAFGGEDLVLAEWAERTGIHKATLRSRVLAGWPLERVFSKRA